MGLKYFSEYRTLNTNELWRVEIHIPPYSGTPIEKMAASGQACIIEHDGGDKLLDKFAIPSSATVTLLFDDDAQTRELMLLADKTAVLRVYRNGGIQLYWQGYLISDGIQNPDSGVMTPITIKAVDMLDAANDIPFANISAEAITVDGVVGAVNSPLNWIRKCLINPDNIDNRLPIRWSCSLKNSQYPTDDFFAGRTGFIPNYDVFASSRQSTSVWWMLENIVKSAGCIMVQRGGYWYIISLVDLAKNSTLDFYEINGNDLAAKTATTVTVDLSKVLPNKLNESTFTMVQKPISKVRSQYNHSMPANIIPNGGFDILDGGNILYWHGVEEYVTVNAVNSINARASGRALRGKNNSFIAMGRVTFSADSISTLPFDADVLFKDMQWGFTFMPIGFPTGEGGIIDWSGNPLNARVLYTVYDEQGNVSQYNLNEFGFWQSSAPADGFKIVSVNNSSPSACVVTFSGNSYNGQRYNRTIGSNIWDISFDGPRTLAQTLNHIALNDPLSPAVSGNSLVYARLPFTATNFYVTEVNPFTSTFIPFKVEGMRNEDVATVQFQSKGNQGRVLMPFPGKLDIENKPVLAGKLSLEFVFKQGQEYIIDDVYMNVSDNKEFWEISDDGNDGLAEYELEISSSFSGFMTSSYMKGFSTSDLSMIMDNGTDRGTLTEIFGKTALRFLSKPTEKIDTEVEGKIGINSLISYNGTTFLPLKSSVNTETNSTNLTVIELVFDENLEIESVHKSTGDGDSSGFSSGGYGYGGNNNGDNLFLTDLKDVAITTPQQGDLLVYNVATGKWENSDDYITLTQLQSIFHPLENQRLSTSNNVTFNGVRGTDYVAIPNSATSVTGIGWTIWVDELGAGGGATPPPVVVNLTDLHDVSISSPTNGQALVYDTASGKWINGNVSVDLTPYALRDASNINVANYKSALGIDNGSTLANNVSGYSMGLGAYTYVDNDVTNNFDFAFVRNGSQEIKLLSKTNLLASLNLGSIYQPLENQRLSTSNNVVFNGVRGTDYVAIPNAAPTSSVSGWAVWVDETGSGGGSTPPPIVVNLTDLQDVAISGATNGQALTYNSTTGKWVNTSIVTDLSNYYTKTESDGRFQPLENQRVSTNNSPTFTGIRLNTSGYYSDILFRHNGLNRWNFYTDATESGSDSGSNLYLASYTDAGTYKSNIFAIDRDSGIMDFTVRPTISGNNILSNDGGTYGISISGNSATVTNGVYTSGSYANPSWITSLAWSKISGKPTTLGGYGITDAYPLSGNPSGFLTTETDPTVPAYAKSLTSFNIIKASTDALYEPIFSKNTAFNKNFGTASGTVAEGNDSRILNGQTAFGWGNHALAGYALANGTNATGTWGGITANRANGLGAYSYIDNDVTTAFDFAFIRNGSQEIKIISKANFSSQLGLPADAYGYTLDGVTTRGNTTTNNITVGGLRASTKLETRGVTSGGTASGAYYDLYVQE